MKCMLLSAGRGNRLRPLTVGKAKPTLPLAGKPLLLYTLERLSEVGVNEVFVNLHHLPDTVRTLVEKGVPRGVFVTFSEEPEILGTAGGLKAVEPLLSGEDPFLLVNGDCYYGFPFAPLVEAHRRSGALATMSLRPMPAHSAFGKVEVDAEGRVARIVGKPKWSPLQPSAERMFTGVHVLSSAIWEYLDRKGNYDINADVYPRCIEGGKLILGADARGPWHDIGTPRRYLAANLDLLHAHPRPTDPSLFPQASIEPPLLCGTGVKLHEGCILQGGVVLGSDVTVGPSCVIARSVILDGARIGARSTLQDAVVAEETTVPANSDLIECVVFPYGGHERELRRRELQGENIVARFDNYERR